MRRVEANRELPKETIGHIQSAGCLGQKEVVIAAHNTCIRELLQEVDGHGKAGRHTKLLTIETENSLGTLWNQEQCTQICSKEELWEAGKEEEIRSRGKPRRRGRQHQKSSIKKDSGGEDWTELAWTRSIKNFWPSNSSEREMREATMWKRR